MANQVRTTFQVNAGPALQQLRNYQQQLRTTIRLQQQMQNGPGAAPPGNGGGGGGGNPLDISFGPLGRMVGFASAGAAAGIALQKTVDIYQAAIEKTIQAEKANRLLSASALEAGKSYGYLAEQNRQFAKQVGLSATQAATTTSQITRLATYAGNSSEQQIETLLQSFADLGAARGISSKDLETLIGTILSGQDEGLNRLGISDPGQLQKAYATQIGKSVDQLTQFEKVQAAVNAVVDKASLYTGAAEARMQGFEGSIARAEAAWANFTEALSGALVNNPEFMQTVNTLTLLLDEMAGLTAGTRFQEIASNAMVGPMRLEDIDEYLAAQDKLQKAFEEDRRRTTQMAKSGWLADGLFTFPGQTGSLTSRVNWWLAQFSGDEQAQTTADQMMFVSGNEALAEEQRWKKIHALKLQQHQADIKAEEDYRAKIQEVRKKNASDLKHSFDIEKITRDYGYRIREAQIKGQLATTKTEELQQLREVTELRRQELQQQVEDVVRQRALLIASGGLTANEELQLRKDSAKQIAQIQQEYRLAEIQSQADIQRKEQEIAEQRKKNLSNLRDTMLAAVSSGNPFVKIFDDTAKGIERVNELTKELGPTFEVMGRQAVTQLTAINLYSQRLQNSIKAVNLRMEAERFANPDPNRDIRREDYVQRQLLNAGYINQKQYQEGEKERRRQAFTQEKQREYDSVEAQNRVDAYFKAIAKTPRPEGLSDYEYRRRRDQAIIEATQNVDPALLRDDQRQAAVEARRREAEATLREEIKAREDLAAIKSAIETGVMVKLAPGYENIVRIVNLSGGLAEVKTNYTGATTAAAYNQ